MAQQFVNHPTLTQSEFQALDYKYKISISPLTLKSRYGTDSGYFCYTPTVTGTWPNLKVTYNCRLILTAEDNKIGTFATGYSMQFGIREDIESFSAGIMSVSYSDYATNLPKYDNTGKTGYNYWAVSSLVGSREKSFDLSSDTDLSMKIVWSTEFWDTQLKRWYSAGEGSLTLSSSNVINSITKPTMTLSASNVTKESATINIKSHTNPLSYWRYQAQWKLSTSSTWTSGSVFELTNSTSTRALNTLTPGATYNYRFAYVDRDGTIRAYSSTLNFTVPEDQATVYVNSGGTVKKAKVWYNNGGTIKKVKNIYYNNSGTIKNVKKV